MSFYCFPYGALLVSTFYGLFAYAFLTAGPPCPYEECRTEGVDNAPIAWATGFFVAASFLLLGIHIIYIRRGLCKAWVAFLAWAIAKFLWALIAFNFGNDGTMDGKGLRGYFVLNLLAYSFATDCLFEVAALSKRLWVTILPEYRSTCCGKNSLRIFEVCLVATILTIGAGNLWCSLDSSVWTNNVVDGAPNDIDDEELNTCIRMVELGQVVFTVVEALIWMAVSCIYAASAKQQIEELDKWYYVWGLPTSLAAAGVIAFQSMLVVFHILAYIMTHSAGIGTTPDEAIANTASVTYNYAVLMTGYFAHNFIARMSIPRHVRAHKINRRNRFRSRRDKGEASRRVKADEEPEEQGEEVHYNDLYDKIHIVPSFPSIESNPSYQSDFGVEGAEEGTLSTFTGHTGGDDRQRGALRRHAMIDDTTTVISKESSVVTEASRPRTPATGISETSYISRPAESVSSETTNNSQSQSTSTPPTSNKEAKDPSIPTSPPLSRQVTPQSPVCWQAFFGASSPSSTQSLGDNEASKKYHPQHERSLTDAESVQSDSFLSWISSFIASSPTSEAQADLEMRQQALDPPGSVSQSDEGSYSVDSDYTDEEAPVAHTQYKRRGSVTKYSLSPEEQARRELELPPLSPRSQETRGMLPQARSGANRSTQLHRDFASDVAVTQERRVKVPDESDSASDVAVTQENSGKGSRSDRSVRTDQATVAGPTVSATPKHNLRSLRNSNIWAVPEDQDDMLFDSDQGVSPPPPAIVSRNQRVRQDSKNTSSLFEDRPRAISTTIIQPQRKTYASLVSAQREKSTPGRGTAIDAASNSSDEAARKAHCSILPRHQASKRPSSLLSGPRTIRRDGESSGSSGRDERDDLASEYSDWQVVDTLA